MPHCSCWTGTAFYHTIILNWIIVKCPRLLSVYTAVRNCRELTPEKHQKGIWKRCEIELGNSKILQQFWDKETLQCKELPLVLNALCSHWGFSAPPPHRHLLEACRDIESNSFLSHTLWWLVKKRTQSEGGGGVGGRTCESEGDF